MKTRLGAALGALLVVLSAACNSVPDSVGSGFDMAKDSLAVQNFAHGFPDSELDATGMQRMFGDSVCVAGSSPCRLTAIAAAWAQKANASMNGGRCEGFAVLSSLLFTHDVDPVSLGAIDARSLKLDGNAALQRELAYWHSTQLVGAVAGDKTKALMPNAVMPVLAEALKPDAKERYRIGIVKKTGGKVTGGHALTPISYHRGDRAGLYLVRVYDSNLPDTERVLTIDTKANRWEYQASRNPSERSSLFFGDASNNNPLFLAPVKTRVGVLPCPFCSGTKTVQTRGGVEATVSGGGATASTTSGEVTSGSGASVAPIVTGLEDEPAAFVFSMPDTDTTISLSNSEGEGAVSVLAEGFAAEVSGLSISPDAGDTLTVGGGHIAYDNVSGTALTLSSTVQRSSGEALVVRASVSAGTGRVETTVDPMTGEVEVKTESASPADVSVTVTKSTQDGGEQTGQITYRTSPDAGSSEVNIATEMWAADAGLPGTVKEGGQTRPATDGCADGTRSGTESDVDCGGMCASKCVVGKQCQAAADCGSNQCSVAGLCVATACDDGRASSGETDVDCGGTTCGPCASSKACTLAADCQSGLCVSNTCRDGSVLGVTLAGLPVGDSVTLANAGGEELTLVGNGSFRFAAAVYGPYAVTVTVQPNGAHCTVANGTGTASGSPVDISVTCVPSYVVGVSLTGLPVGNSVSLTNNGGDLLTLNGDGSYAFSARVTGAYAVAVSAQPSNAVCTVANGSGTATGAVTVNVTCAVAWPIGGTVSGLPSGETVTLTNNGGDALTVSANGSFTFAARVLSAYAVAVSVQPASAVCAVSNGSGNASAAVSSVVVNCTPSWRIGGTLSGLPASASVTLRNNGADPLVLSANGSFNFSSRIVGAYAVTVGTQPAGALCSVTNGAGNATADVSAVQVSCVPAFVIGGTLTGLPPSTTITLTNNGGDPLTLNGNGAFAFSIPTQAYAVAIQTPPPGVRCAVSNGSGNAAANVSNIAVTCTPSGLLDTTFNSGGYYTNAPSQWQQEWFEGVVLSDDSQVYVGRHQPNIIGDDDWVITKLTPAGQPDPAFGVGGYAALSSGASATEYARSVIALPDNSLVVAGQLSNAGTAMDVTLLRLTATGAVDTSWGTSGRAVYSTAVSEYGNAVIPASGGGYLVAGYRGDGTAADAIIVKFTATGQLDTTFGTGGVFTWGTAGVDDQGWDLVQTSGSSLLLLVQSGLDTALVAVTAGGALDTSFGTAGVATFDFSGGGRTEFPRRMKYVASPASVLFVGWAYQASAVAGFLARATLPSLTLDPAFGSNGLVLFDNGGAGAFWRNLNRQSDGRILVSGNGLMALRYSAQGVLDTSWGSNGVATPNVGNHPQKIGHFVLIDSLDRAYLGGTFGTVNPDLGVCRLTP